MWRIPTWLFHGFFFQQERHVMITCQYFKSGKQILTFVVSEKTNCADMHALTLV